MSTQGSLSRSIDKTKKYETMEPNELTALEPRQSIYITESEDRLLLLNDSNNNSSSGNNDGRNNSLGNINKRISLKLFQRGSVWVVLISVGLGICLMVFFATQHQLRKLHQTQFDNYAQQISQQFLSAFQTQIWTAYTLSTTITTEAAVTSQSFPSVILSHFQRRSLGLQQQLGQSTSIRYAPLVTDEIRAEWEQYMVDHQDELDLRPDESNASCQGRHGDDQQQEVEEGEHHKLQDGIVIIKGGDNRSSFFASDPGPGPYLPIAQILPSSDSHRNDNCPSPDSPAQLIMWNQISSEAERKAFDMMLRTKSPVLTGVDLITATKQPQPPSSALFYPIFHNALPNAVTGALSLEFSWGSMFQDIVSPPGKLCLVLSNDSPQKITFELIQGGGMLQLVGEDDFHDPGFDKFRRSLSLHTEPSLWNSTYSLLTADDTTVDFEASLEGARNYQLDIYPTTDFEQQYVKPATAAAFAATAGALFALGIGFLVIYDNRMQRWKEANKSARKQRGRSNVIKRFIPTLIGGPIAENDHCNSIDGNHVRQKKSGWTAPFWSSDDEDDGDDESSDGDDDGTEDAFPKQILEPAKTRLRSFLHNGEISDFSSQPDDLLSSQPIADLFSNTTIMFADIAGFSAWSSEREPHQIFLLLETLYRAFDDVANRLGVFKVETIGDCYVAVAGLPDPDNHHAITMAKLAWECKSRMNELVKELEVQLGPGTSDLALRVGLHSGAVTAGVLRGEKARFQLFGDTMNTASRMESAGVRNRIQVSLDTAKKLKRDGKAHWLTPREELVDVKGRGDMQTYWLTPIKAPAMVPVSHEEENDSTRSCDSVRSHEVLERRSSRYSDKWGHLELEEEETVEDKKARLVHWNVETLGALLAKVVAWREGRHRRAFRSSESSISLDSETESGFVLEEVTEVIKLPSYSDNASRNGTTFSEVLPLQAEVRVLLHDYVQRLADFYHNVPFHNLEHASHVTLSANKLMRRIISPGESDFAPTLDAEEQEATAAAQGDDGNDEETLEESIRRRKSLNEMNDVDLVEKNLHNSTFGISSDPLTQFAIVFSALIHDVDHTGVPNNILVNEKAPIALKYDNKSVAEQNSVDIAWNMLMEDKYVELRTAIYGDEKERKRFRQLVVNSVMATDIFDKELSRLRKNRWSKAFDETKVDSKSLEDVNRKATIVIEHIIQASDVAHTMQHWHIYCKWNERLFQEMYLAYLNGRSQKDPCPGWYGGELWFFDNYIIPLAKKLKECGVFGVFGDEYLNYALENRNEWERKGKLVCQNMVVVFRQKYPDLVPPPPPLADGGS